MYLLVRKCIVHNALSEIFGARYISELRPFWTVGNHVVSICFCKEPLMGLGQHLMIQHINISIYLEGTTRIRTTLFLISLGHQICYWKWIADKGLWTWMRKVGIQDHSLCKVSSLFLSQLLSSSSLIHILIIGAINLISVHIRACDSIWS